MEHLKQGRRFVKHSAFVRGDAETHRKAAEALEALNAGAPLSSVEIPPGVIIDPTPKQIAEQCRPFGLKPPATIPKAGWRSPIFMSVRVLGDVWKHSKAKRGTRLVLLALADFANDAGEAWPSVESLAAKTHLSERDIQYALRILERLGEIKTLRNKGPRGCNLYQITTKTGGASLAPAQVMQGARNDTGGARNDTKGVQVLAPNPSVDPSIEPSEEGAQAPVAVSGDSPAPASLKGHRAKKPVSNKVTADDVATAWAAEPKLPQIRNLTVKRRKVIAARLKDDFFARHYQEAIAKVAASSFCNGQNERHWRADIDWFLKPDTVVRIMEGKYGGQAPAQSDDRNLVRPRPGQPTVEEVNRAAWDRRMKARAEREAAEREQP